MPLIYSTMTEPVEYTLYNKDMNPGTKIAKAATPVKSIRVEGGANKFLDRETPVGTATQVTDEELDLLRKNKVFARQLERGFLVVVATNKGPDVKKVAKDMTKRDESAPLSEEHGDFKEGGRAGGTKPKDSKVK